jgi:hypothetical protein
MSITTSDLLVRLTNSFPKGGSRTTTPSTPTSPLHVRVPSFSLQTQPGMYLMFLLRQIALLDSSPILRDALTRCDVSVAAFMRHVYTMKCGHIHTRAKNVSVLVPTNVSVLVLSTM